MIRNCIAFAAAVSLLASPGVAAALDAPADPQERRSGAGIGMYLSLPLGGARSGGPQAGLRLQMIHDHRTATAPTAPAVRANALDLRLLGDRQPTFYLAGVPVNGEEARKRNLAGVGTLATLAILGAAAVGAVVIFNAIDDDEENQCLLPEGCP